MKNPLSLVFSAIIACAALGEGPPAPAISNVAYSPSGKFLAAGGAEGVIRVFDVNPGGHLIAAQTQNLTGHTAPILAIGFSATNTLVSVSLDQTAKIWNFASGKLLHSTDLNFGKQLVPAIAPRGQPFLAGGRLKQVRLWNYQTGELLKTFEANDSNVAALAFTPDGKLLVIGTTKGVVRVMDVAAWKVTRSIDLDTPVRSLAASTNHILVGYSDGEIALLDFADQSSIPEVKEQAGAILALAFSPKGDRFAAASIDNTVKVWDTKTLKLLCSRGDTAAVLSVTFSPDGQNIAAANADRNVMYSTITPSPPAPRH